MQSGVKGLDSKSDQASRSEGNKRCDSQMSEYFENKAYQILNDKKMLASEKSNQARAR